MRHRCGWAGLIGALGFTLAGCSGPAAQDGVGIEIRVLSNRADLVSGGDALVEITVPDAMSPDTTSMDALRVDVDGSDVSHAFAIRPDGRITGLITELKDGPNLITARLKHRGSQLTVTNHPVGGPIFSGPQVQPWICATPVAEPATATSPATNASGLSAAAIDAQCNVAREYRYFYRTSEPCSQSPRGEGPPCFKPYELNAASPADLAETVTDEGIAMKYIVRVERGVINRAIYDVAVLFDPTMPWTATEPQAAWNRKLLWSFGGGSGTPYKQFPPNSTWQIDYALARGFMTAVSAHTDQALNSNHVVAGETVMMGKEHIADTYGEIRYTIGTGCSGGSIMQLQLASMYPGLLDGIQPACTYPDSYSTSMEVMDCVLLDRYFDSPAFAALTSKLTPAQINAKKAAIAGHMDERACPAWVSSFGSANTPGVYRSPRTAETVNNCHLLDSQVYDRVKNPQGVRCSIPEYAMAIWGAMPGTRVAPRTLDNVGIQYGLKALEAGGLSAEEFVVLNEKIGGSDVDVNPADERMRADPRALQIAYEAGLIGDARQWAKIPIIDLRGSDNAGIHMNWRAFAVRERLDRINGGHDNQAIWRYGPGLAPPPRLAVDALLTIDQWVADIRADGSDVPVQQKVIRNKPAGAFDFCHLGTDYDTKVTDPDACDADPMLKYYASPRQAAGGPLSEDVLKCELKPLRRADYNTQFSDAQWSRLNQVFAEGVCDWSKPGVGMQASTPWRTFAEGPGGKPMPAAPVSRPL